MKENQVLNTLFIADMGNHPCCLWARSSTAMTAADLCPPGQLFMIASIRFLKGKREKYISTDLKTKSVNFTAFCLHTFWFSGVNSNGVSGLFSGVSLCFRRRKRKCVKQGCGEIIHDGFTVVKCLLNRQLQLSSLNKTDTFQVKIYRTQRIKLL